MTQASQPELERFDPVAGFFLAQSDRPASLESINAAELTPLQRALLVIDGTVTTFLEAWALEPVVVTCLWQRPQKLAVPDRWLDLPAGATLPERAVLLSGARSRGFFAYAESRINADFLLAAMRGALEAEGGNLTRVARRLGISRPTLYRKLDHFGIRKTFAG